MWGDAFEAASKMTYLGLNPATRRSKQFVIDLLQIRSLEVFAILLKRNLYSKVFANISRLLYSQRIDHELLLHMEATRVFPSAAMQDNMQRVIKQL
jgi:hypothetical protein